jgi:hypothetical protein
MTVDFSVPLFTNVKRAKECVNALLFYRNNRDNQPGYYPLEIKAWEEYR